MAKPGMQPSKSEALHLQIARNIRNAIEAGALRHGEALPTTRELASEWGTSVFTISEAMKVLSEEGVIVSKSRSKRMVYRPDQQAREEIKPSRPHVLLIGGYAGSGKSELGRILARETGWPILDKDTLTRPVVEMALEIMGLSPNDRESAGYINSIRPREYEALNAATLENVECGNSAIVTAPFIREFRETSWIERTQATFAALKATTSLVWVYCDASTMHTYIRHRGAARDAVKLADWGTYLTGIDTEFRPEVSHYEVNNCTSSTPLQTQAKELLLSILKAGEG